MLRRTKTAEELAESTGADPETVREEAEAFAEMVGLKDEEQEGEEDE